MFLVARRAVWRPRPAETRFVIFGQGRSGSTLLVSLLGSHGRTHCDGEILYSRLRFPRAFIDASAALHRGRIYGFKLLSYQLRDVQRLARPEAFLRGLGEDGFRILYLRRRNLLRHALSNLYARETEFHRVDGAKKGPARRIDVNVADVLEWIRVSGELASFEQRVLRDLPHLPLTYEDDLETAASQQATADRVFAYLGTETEQVASTMQKVAPRSIADMVVNHEELIAALRDSPHAEFLEDA